MNIIVGVSAGIAIYKSLELIRAFVKRGDNVKVVMTSNSQKFISAELFKEISLNDVLTDVFVNAETAAHIKIAQWSDALIIAPATANIIAKIANGIADDSLSTVALAHLNPLFIAPAMNSNMYLNPATQANIQTLKSRGIHIIEPNSGSLACGVNGIGRLPEPSQLLQAFDSILNVKKDLIGKKFLITAGATREPIDPVRYITNHSTGKMGHAIANVAASRGADVVLISSSSLPVDRNIRLINVDTAIQMHDAVLSEFHNSNVVIMAAAVADYHVKLFSNQKIKKSDDILYLELVRNPDILKELGQIKTSQILIGFAAETQNLQTNAIDKLNRKNLDMIVANDVSRVDAGFAVDTNIVTLITKDDIQQLPLLSKFEVAQKIVDYASNTLGTLK